MNVLEKDKTELSDGSEEEWPEERLFELFRILKPLSLNYLKATHLLPNLPFLRSHAGTITKAERKSPPDATELVFNLILESKEPESWKKFAIALKKAEFLSLYRVCRVCERSDFDFFIEIFDLLSTDFAENGVDILNLSIGMLSLNSLTQNQFQRIKIVFYEEGEVGAILEFISCLPISLDIWIKNILASLYGVNKINLCKLIKKKGSEINISAHGDLEHLFDIFHDEIQRRVRPQDIKVILRAYDLMPDMNLNALSPMEEMQKIFSYIEKRQVAGKWRSFVNALKISGYDSLYAKLTDEGKISDDSQEVERIKVMTPNIVKSIDMNFELLLQIKNELINQRCAQEINRKKNESGNLAAAEMLLENIHRFKNDWYHKFLKILTNVGQDNVALMIEPDFQCIQSAKCMLEDESEDVALDTEPYFQCTQKAKNMCEDESECRSSKGKVNKKQMGSSLFESS